MEWLWFRGIRKLNALWYTKQGAGKIRDGKIKQNQRNRPRADRLPTAARVGNRPTGRSAARQTEVPPRERYPSSADILGLGACMRAWGIEWLLADGSRHTAPADAQPTAVAGHRCVQFFANAAAKARSLAVCGISRCCEQKGWGAPRGEGRGRDHYWRRLVRVAE